MTSQQVTVRCEDENNDGKGEYGAWQERRDRERGALKLATVKDFCPQRGPGL